MNTVDALKKLYKTLSGKDYAGDPNPTDAEMIDAIAADAQSGGSGGSLVFPIEIDSTDPENMMLVTPFEECVAAVQAGKKLGLPGGPDGTAVAPIDFGLTINLNGDTCLVSNSCTLLPALGGSTWILGQMQILPDGTIANYQKTLS